MLWVFKKKKSNAGWALRSDHLPTWVHLSSVSHQISLCQNLISHALEGLVYYHTYDRFFLGTSVVLGFVGWTSYIVLLILKTHASLSRSPSVLRQVRAYMLMSSSVTIAGKTTWRDFTSLIFVQIPKPALVRGFMCAAAVITAFLLLQRSPVTYYIYCLLPIPVWYSVFREWVRHAQT